MFSSVALMCVLCASAAFASDIDIEPTDQDVKCGDSVTFTWTYDKDVPAGTTLNFSFRKDETFGTKLIVANIGSTVTKESDNSFTYTFPKPLPEAWTNGVEESVQNDGKNVAVFLYAESASDPEVNSLSGTFESHQDFKFSCCPDGLPDCPCNNGGCQAPNVCHVGDNKCIEGGKRNGPCKIDGTCNNESDECLNNECLAKGACKDKDANGKWNTGTIGCPCSENNTPKCVEGAQCDVNGICQAAMNSINGLACSRANAKGPDADACIRHPEGAGAGDKPSYSCQGDKCTACQPGTELCTCNNQQCNTVAGKRLVCQNVAGLNAAPRCFEQFGCDGCKCLGAGQTCNGGLHCVSGLCRPKGTTTQPGGNVGQTTTAACRDGTEGCPCAMNAQGQLGCVSGLSCSADSKVCTTGSAATPLLAVAVAIVAVIAQAL